jgi:hypothetical protein
MSTMALAKGLTFYNRYGFTNDAIKTFIAEFRPMLLRELDTELNTEFESLAQLKLSSLKDVAQWILDQCINQVDLTPKMISFMTRFQDIIYKKMPSARFTKPYTHANYDLEIENNDVISQLAFTTLENPPVQEAAREKPLPSNTFINGWGNTFRRGWNSLWQPRERSANPAKGGVRRATRRRATRVFKRRKTRIRH